MSKWTLSSHLASSILELVTSGSCLLWSLWDCTAFLWEFLSPERLPIHYCFWARKLCGARKTSETHKRYREVQDDNIRAFHLFITSSNTQPRPRLVLNLLMDADACLWRYLQQRHQTGSKLTCLKIRHTATQSFLTQVSKQTASR